MFYNVFIKKISFYKCARFKFKRIWIRNGIDENKLFVLHSKINANKFKLTDNKKIFDFIYLGRLAREKQVHIIIKGIYEMKNRGLNVKFVIVGDGPEMKNLKKLTNILNLNSNITFTGFVDNPEILYNQAKVFLLCSKSEALPTALMQAMACKLVAIAPNIGNISDIIENNYNGFLYESDNIQSFYNIMEKTYLNYDILNIVRENAREKILKEYTYENATSQWDHIIKTKFVGD